MTAQYFVFVHDYGFEGKGPPFQIVEGEEQAKALFGLLRAADAHLIVVYKCPMWPAVNPIEHYNREPVAWCLPPKPDPNIRKIAPE